MSGAKYEIVVYQPDEATHLEVRLEDETVWLTQSQIETVNGNKHHKGRIQHGMTSKMVESVTKPEWGEC